MRTLLLCSFSAFLITLAASFSASAASFTSLGDLAGGIFQSFAFGTSADGSTVVWYSTSASGAEAFIWDATNGMQSLQVLLTTLGIDLTGWQLQDARGISADGKTIVGYGINPSGFTEAFIAVVPEPGTGLLLGFGLALAAASRPRWES